MRRRAVATDDCLPANLAVCRVGANHVGHRRERPVRQKRNVRIEKEHEVAACPPKAEIPAVGRPTPIIQPQILNRGPHCAKAFRTQVSAGIVDDKSLDGIVRALGKQPLEAPPELIGTVSNRE